MGKLFVKMMLNSKLYKHVFVDEGIKRDCRIYVLLTDKNSMSGQYVCNLNTGYICIPSTALLRNEESAKLHLTVAGPGAEKYKFKDFIISIHSIASYDNFIDKNLNFEYTIFI